MRWSTVFLLALGVVSALVAATLVSSIQGRRGPAAAGQDPQLGRGTARVLVASNDLGAFQIVDATDVESREVPAGELPEGALSSRVDVIGRILLEPLAAGHPFRAGGMAEGPEVDLASAIVPGKRAISLPLDPSLAAGDLIRPGSVVDVIATLTAGDQPVSMTLLQSVLVLAVGDRTLVSRGGGSGESGPATTVSLLVDVREAESLSLVREAGSVSLVLRNPADSEVVAFHTTRLRELTPRVPSPAGSTPAASRVRDVVVMKGGTTEVRTVRTGEEDG